VAAEISLSCLQWSDNYPSPNIICPVPCDYNHSHTPKGAHNLHKITKDLHMRGLSGKYPAILNISRTGRVALIYLGSQSEETLLGIEKLQRCSSPAEGWSKKKSAAALGKW